MVKWHGQSGITEVSLSKTIVAPDIKSSLLSVPALVQKEIAVLFVPGKAMFIDLLYNNSMIGYAKHRADGLFFIADFQENKNPVA